MSEFRINLHVVSSIFRLRGRSIGLFAGDLSRTAYGRLNVALSRAFPRVGCSTSLRGELASVRAALPERLHPAALDRRGCPLGGEERDQSLRRFNVFRSRYHCD